MAQIDSRAGFRLPWSSERPTTESSDVQVEGAGEGVVGPGSADAADTSPVAESSVTAEGNTVNETASALGTSAKAAAAELVRPAPRKPSKFLADLSRAMQAAAEEARNGTLVQLHADAKVHVEKIHERSASEAAALRRAADDDVAAVREWSKAEIARIREETENRITARKGRLESEIEGHAAQIEREIERVQGRVSAFEHEMAEFFERLLAEDDPTRIATMAERLPEPPPFDDVVTDDAAAPYAGPVTDAPVGAIVEPEVATAEVETVAVADAHSEIADAPIDLPELNVPVPADFAVDREAAFAAIQAAAEAAASAEVATDAAERAEAVADIAIEIVGAHDDDAAFNAPDFDAAEAEAAASADAAGDADEIPVIADEALAARLADLLPSDDQVSSSEAETTQVVVTGLVSVASIASFKRHLGRLAGVTSVGVSSGPDGEFLFAVQHTADIVLRDAIPSLPSFQARVTGSGDGTLTVTAHDPESDH